MLRVPLRVDNQHGTSTVTGIALCVTSTKENCGGWKPLCYEMRAYTELVNARKVCTVDDGDGVVVKWRCALGANASRQQQLSS
jgi:hypothetical protein